MTQVSAKGGTSWSHRLSDLYSIRQPSILDGNEDSVVFPLLHLDVQCTTMGLLLTWSLIAIGQDETKPHLERYGSVPVVSGLPPIQSISASIFHDSAFPESKLPTWGVFHSFHST